MAKPKKSYYAKRANTVAEDLKHRLVQMTDDELLALHDLTHLMMDERSAALAWVEALQRKYAIQDTNAVA